MLLSGRQESHHLLIYYSLRLSARFSDLKKKKSQTLLSELIRICSDETRCLLSREDLQILVSMWLLKAFLGTSHCDALLFLISHPGWGVEQLSLGSTTEVFR